MPWRPGKSPVSTNVLRPGTPTRSPAAESVALPALGSANPLVRSRDIAVGGISLATQVGNTLDPWTPSLTFGGGTTGITYTQQFGYIFDLGKLAVALYEIVLTSKGTSTGVATIAGLPIPSLPVGAVSVNFVMGFYPMSYANMNTTTAAFGAGVAGNNATSISLVKFNNGTAANIAMADTDFTNTSQIGGLAIYLTA